MENYVFRFIFKIWFNVLMKLFVLVFSNLEIWFWNWIVIVRIFFIIFLFCFESVSVIRWWFILFLFFIKIFVFINFEVVLFVVILFKCICWWMFWMEIDLVLEMWISIFYLVMVILNFLWYFVENLVFSFLVVKVSLYGM